MDRTQALELYRKQIEFERKQKIEMELMMAECINMAYIGSQPSQPGKVNNGFKTYKKWRQDKIKILYPDLEKPTIFDRIGKKSFKLN